MPVIQRDRCITALRNRCGKILARGDRPPVADLHWNEFLGEAEHAYAKSVLVILGQTAGLEDAVGIPLSQHFERAPGEPCAHAVRRNEAAHRLPGEACL